MHHSPVSSVQCISLYSEHAAVMELLGFISGSLQSYVSLCGMWVCQRKTDGLHMNLCSLDSLASAKSTVLWHHPVKVKLCLAQGVTLLRLLRQSLRDCVLIIWVNKARSRMWITSEDPAVHVRCTCLLWSNKMLHVSVFPPPLCCRSSL